ncbi:MAG: hypothetical protein LBK96_03565 [Prevotellaceae bacterium]|jgi:hypothetical protein|nr:hypothetical protein [Prevotellaceae bacterium]
MKRNFLMMAFVSLFTVVALCSCGKDEEENDDKDGNGENAWIQGNTITAVVENGASYYGKIDAVRAEVNGYAPLVSVNYIDGGFTLTLPANINTQYLYNPADEDDYYIDEGVTISNPNVKVAEMYLGTYKSNSYTGYIYYGTEDWEGRFIYADGDVSITGLGSEWFKWNAHLKKGWNMVYGKEMDNEFEFTTQVPAGTKKWYFYDDTFSTSGSLRTQVSPLSAKHKLRFLSESGFSGLKD